MISQTKYIIHGMLLALLFIIVISVLSSSIFYVNVRHKPLIDTTASATIVYAITNVKGQKLFSENCSSCHALLKRDGGQLFGIEERVKDKTLLHEWIRNSSKVLRSGNHYFNAQVKEYGVMMPDFPNLTDVQIDDILDYIKQAELMRHNIHQ